MDIPNSNLRLAKQSRAVGRRGGGEPKVRLFTKRGLSLTSEVIQELKFQIPNTGHPISFDSNACFLGGSNEAAGPFLNQTLRCKLSRPERSRTHPTLACSIAASTLALMKFMIGKAGSKIVVQPAGQLQ